MTLQNSKHEWAMETRKILKSRFLEINFGNKFCRKSIILHYTTIAILQS